jgi:hypothetical protein
MPLDSLIKRGRLMSLLMRLPAWAYMALALGGLAAALAAALLRAA